VPPKPIGDKHVLCPFQIQMCDLQGGIGLGTAFFYEADGENFIITNWHNVAGKDPFTGEHIHEEGRTPTFMRAKWPVMRSEQDGLKYARWEAQNIEIEDSRGPLWFEHPEFGSLCDVVAIQSDRPGNWPAPAHIAANKIDETSIPTDPGLKIIVIGFPHGMSTGPGLPLMKTGALSSMPGYNVNLRGEFSNIGGMKGGISLPILLTDVHTVPGMSGSPIFGEYSGLWDPLNLARGGEMTDSTWIGTSRKFLGCHSSRLWDQEERAGLGICYPENVILDICRSKHKGNRFPQRIDDTGFTYT
jgi:hypothetical protein